MPSRTDVRARGTDGVLREARVRQGLREAPCKGQPDERGQEEIQNREVILTQALIELKGYTRYFMALPRLPSKFHLFLHRYRALPLSWASSDRRPAIAPSSILEWNRH